MIIEGHLNLGKRILTLTASWVIDVVTGQSFYVLVENFSNNWSQVSKHILIAIGNYTPQLLAYMTDGENI